LSQIGTSLWLFSTREAYSSPLGTGIAFTQFDPDSFPLAGLELRSSSFAIPNPADDREVYFTGNPLGSIQFLYTFKITMPTSASGYRLVGLNTPPRGLAADPASSALFYSRPTPGAGITKLSSSGDGTPVLTFGNSGPGTLNSPGALAFGPDGRLYVLDTGDNRVVSFDTDGNYQSAFALADTAASTALAIDSRGFLYTADGNGGAAVYNTATGQHVGSLRATSGTADTAGGHTLVAVDDQNHVYLYDQTTGLHVFDVTAVPEPATTGAVVAGFLLLGCLHRRRRK
jgi:outer membrane protein assembly factor BamB